MDAVTIATVLAAIAGGAGGALGSQAWAGLSALVRRPVRRDRAADGATAPLPSGSAELTALDQVPTDEGRAVALAEVLITRADGDGEFRKALDTWWEQASQILISGEVTNTVSGGIQYGPVLQGRDFSGLTFGSPAGPPPGPPGQDHGA